MLTFVYQVNIRIFEYATGSCKDISSITSTQYPVHSALNGCRAYDCVGVMLFKTNCMEKLNIGDIVRSDCGAVGEIVHIVNEVENSDNPKCIVLTGFPFEGAEEIILLSGLQKHVACDYVLNQPLPF